MDNDERGASPREGRGDRRRAPAAGLRTSVRQYLGYMVEERERGVQGSKCIIKSVRVHVKRIFKISITLGNLLDSVVECTGAQTRLVNGS